jgi:hypothetical protein
VVGVLARLAPVALLAVSIGGCNQTINPYGGPVVTSVSSAGLFTEGGCVTRNITVMDPVTGEFKPIRQRFCGGRPIPATDRAAAAAPVQKAAGTQTLRADLIRGNPRCSSGGEKNAASSSETANSPPVQGLE